MRQAIMNYLDIIIREYLPSWLPYRREFSQNCNLCRAINKGGEIHTEGRWRGEEEWMVVGEALLEGLTMDFKSFLDRLILENYATRYLHR
jgi:hypothetical protein